MLVDHHNEFNEKTVVCVRAYVQSGAKGSLGFSLVWVLSK